jgi:hypothetical protein
MFPNIIHPPVLFETRSVSDTGFYLRLQVQVYSVGSTQ